MILFNLFLDQDLSKSLKISILKNILCKEAAKKHQLSGLQPIQ